jgi:hypothetical protein
MKWKSSLNAEEAALFAVNAESYRTIFELQVAVSDLEDVLANQSFTLGEIEDGYVDVTAIPKELDQLHSKLNEAKAIEEALLEEIIISYDEPFGAMTPLSQLVLSRIVFENEMGHFSSILSKVTKKSLACWFLQHDHVIAKKFWPSITDDLAVAALDSSTQQINKHLVSKTENSYLRLINALSDALVGGLTGQPNKDADAILAALAAGSAEAPITQKTLAKYLKKSSELL